MLHVDFFLSRTFGMIVFITFGIFAFHWGSTSIFFTNKALISESLFLNILDSFDTDQTVFLFKETLGNPYGTNIMNPNIVARRLSNRMSWFYKIVIIRLLIFFHYFFCFFWTNIFFLLFTESTFFWILVELRICFFE